jgi:hypothetical protein
VACHIDILYDFPRKNIFLYIYMRVRERERGKEEFERRENNVAE